MHRNHDPNAIENRVAKSSPQELINLERTEQVYPKDRPNHILASNVPFKGAWDSGRVN